MKTKNLFLLTIVLLFGVIVESSGQQNVVVPSNNSTFGKYNILVGDGVGTLIPNDPTIFGNIYLGHNSGKSTTIGKYNVFLGYSNGRDNTTGIGNTFVGHQTGVTNTTTSYNTALGYQCGGTGEANVNIGFLTGAGNSGSNNVCIGYEAGYCNPVLANTGNVFIGFRAGKNLQSNNKLVVRGMSGYGELMFGDFVDKYLNLNGKVGVGLLNNPIPGNSLEVRGLGFNQSGLRFTNLTSAFVPTSNALKFLTVDSAGDVILQNLPPSSGTDSQTLSIVGNQLTISNGNTVNLPAPLSCNLYTCDGVIDDNSTFDNLRYVDMNHNNIHFGTSFSEYGKIYIGQSAHPSFEFLDTMNQTNLENYKLFVEGGIITERVKVALRNSLDWADYVFADNYKLMPLNELETFVKENKHLPGVKSAEELSKSGIDVVDMQSKQMEKIEELTLYAIEQNKQIDKQSIEIENQSKELEKQAKELEELKAQVKSLLERK